MTEKVKRYLMDMIGEEQLDMLLDAGPEYTDTVIISGPKISGKTTLARVLRAEGYNVVEDFCTVTIRTLKPLDTIVRNFNPMV